MTLFTFLGILGIVGSILGIVYAEKTSEVLEDWGMLRLGLEKSELEKVTQVRGIFGILLIVFLIFMTGNFQLITGIIGMTIGGLIMYYSVPIHRFLAAGMPASKYFRGDDGIKLAGVLIFLFSALWMSGITQNMIIWFFGSAGLIPDPNL